MRAMRNAGPRPAQPTPDRPTAGRPTPGHPTSASRVAAARAVFAALIATGSLLPLATNAGTIDFEDVGAGLAGPESFYNGSDGAGGFSSGGAALPNTFTDFGGGCCWEGWSYSNVTDNTTPGLANQYSAFPGGGAAGSATYGISFSTNRLSLPSPSAVSGGHFANTTWAALSMQIGDAFAKPFGGESGDDPDFFLLTISGRDARGEQTASVDLYLADYRFADNARDFILDEWAFVDLNPLGVVSSLQFDFSSSDVGPFGINTPTYFALDDLSYAPAVPEPFISLGLGLVLGALTWRRRVA